MEPKKHKHYDLMMQYYADMNQDLWVWSEFDEEWLKKDDEFFYSENWNYALGEKPTSPPVKMIKYPNGTIEFPAPVKSLNENQKYYSVVIRDLHIIITTNDTFSNHHVDKGRLNSGLVHLTREAAELHTKAFAEFLQNHQPK